MCKSTQDLTIWLSMFAQTLQVDDHEVSIQIYADKSFRIYVHTRQEDPVYDTDEWGSKLDINDLAYEDPETFAMQIKETLNDASSEQTGVLSAEEIMRIE